MVTVPKPGNFPNTRAQIIVFNYINDLITLLAETGDTTGSCIIAYYFNWDMNFMFLHNMF